MTSTDVRGQILEQAESRTIRANGLDHRVLTFGTTGRQDLVFVPGITSPAETAHFIAAALPHYRMHVPDLRGRGKTDRAASGAYTLVDYRDDLAGVIAGLGLEEDPVVVGHSLGARIVGAWAAADGSAGSAVVLVDPPLSGPGRDPYPMSVDSFLAQLTEARRGTTPDEIRTYFPAWPERELQLRSEVLAECDETAVRETHRGFEEEDFFEVWDRLPGGVALIYGARSPVVRDLDVDELRRRNPRIPVLSVPDAGHMVPWDNLAGFTTALGEAIAAAETHV